MQCKVRRQCLINCLLSVLTCLWSIHAIVSGTIADTMSYVPAALKTAYQSLLTLTLLALWQQHNGQVQFWDPRVLDRPRLKHSRQSMQAWVVGGCPGGPHSSLGASGSSSALRR